MVKSSERRWRFGNDLDLCRMPKQRANFVPEFASNEIKALSVATIRAALTSGLAGTRSGTVMQRILRPAEKT
jgi:hypothetical protein